MFVTAAGTLVLLLILGLFSAINIFVCAITEIISVIRDLRTKTGRSTIGVLRVLQVIGGLYLIYALPYGIYLLIIHIFG